MTDARAYDLAGNLVSEAYTGGLLNGLSVSNQFDQFLRRTNVAVLGATTAAHTAYAYDSASGLALVDDGNMDTASYSYIANSPLVGQIGFKQNGQVRMTTSKQYDFLNRLAQISSAPSVGNVLPSAFNYSYNAANQRTQDVLADGSYWSYGYDALGQVTNGCKYFSDGTLVAGEQFNYAFDTIGNRTQTRTGGDATGANLRVANYYANNLNQITNRDIPAYVEVSGASLLTNAVTVNGQSAYRKGEYFRQEVPANNSGSALWTNMIVSGGLSVTGNVYVAREPETLRYDADGNLTNDGRWAYTWDAENRLIRMTVNTNVGPQYQLSFAYDAQGRRIQKLVATNNGVAYVGQYTNRFLYNGWNVLATLNPQSAIVQSFTWGTDLSGSMQGAGGVGGLLAVSYHGTATTNCFVAYDGNGNVVALINAADGTIAGSYEYGPFGEVIRQTGPIAKANPFRFSTKYQDDESDLLYYGYRYYKFSTGAWVRKDPIGEPGFEASRNGKADIINGGVNIYLFALNNALSQLDATGLKIYKVIIHDPNDRCFGSIHHRIVVCDDGKGGSYTIEKGGANCCCTSGTVGDSWCTYNHHEYSAEHLLGNLMTGPGSVVVRTIDTSTNVDAYLNYYASELKDKHEFYVFIFKDCGNFANEFMDFADGLQNPPKDPPTVSPVGPFPPFL